MKIGEVIDTLISTKDEFRNHLLPKQIDAINYACNLIEACYMLQDDARAVLDRIKEGD